MYLWISNLSLIFRTLIDLLNWLESVYVFTNTSWYLPQFLFIFMVFFLPVECFFYSFFYFFFFVEKGTNFCLKHRLSGLEGEKCDSVHGQQTWKKKSSITVFCQDVGCYFGLRLFSFIFSRRSLSAAYLSSFNFFFIFDTSL